MKIVHSSMVEGGQSDPRLSTLLASVAEDQLRQWIDRLAIPRHFTSEPEANRSIADWLTGLFQVFGYSVERQGPHSNIVALPGGPIHQAVIVGAHYDSVPSCPGADDNASAVAAMLTCAAICSRWDRALPVVFVAFNREEEGLRGSQDFVESYLPAAPFLVQGAHILEMVGFASSVPGSQRVPTGLPIKMSDSGDFLGLLANRQSGQQMDLALRQGQTYVPGLAITGLEVEQGFERVLPVLARSDHVPFWANSIPAVMWTDTAEFRNPHYHRPTDTPGTLDYRFLSEVTRVLAATVISQTTESG